MNRKNKDTKWKALNQYLEECMAKGDFYGMGIAYIKMAKVLEIEGKPFNSFKEMGINMKRRHASAMLQNYSLSKVVTEVDILCAQDACERCRKWNNKKYSLIDAINHHYLPESNCEHVYGCRCTYLPVVKSD